MKMNLSKQLGVRRTHVVQQHSLPIHIFRICCSDNIFCIQKLLNKKAEGREGCNKDAANQHMLYTCNNAIQNPDSPALLYTWNRRQANVKTHMLAS